MTHRTILTKGWTQEAALKRVAAGPAGFASVSSKTVKLPEEPMSQPPGIRDSLFPRHFGSGCGYLCEGLNNSPVVTSRMVAEHNRLGALRGPKPLLTD